MSVKEIKNVNIIYKTSDGNYFSNRDDAQIHENRLMYEKMIDEGENIKFYMEFNGNQLEMKEYFEFYQELRISCILPLIIVLQQLVDH